MAFIYDPLEVGGWRLEGEGETLSQKFLFKDGVEEGKLNAKWKIKSAKCKVKPYDSPTPS
jgi:hypothetical protein